MDINAKVLAAFQVEHREHLEGIRATLVPLGASPHAATDRTVIDEAFRLAHSLKGGARVCGLESVESLAHGLESLLGNARDSGESMTESNLEAIRKALDAIEDRMAALVNVKPALISESQEPPAPATSVDSISNDLRQKLLVAFEEEYHEYIKTFRAFVASASEPDAVTSDELISECYRSAHSLKGAARVVELSPVEQLSFELEALFARVREGTLKVQRNVTEAIGTATDVLEEEIAGCRKGLGSARVPAAVTQLKSLIGDNSQTAPVQTPAAEAPQSGPAVVGETLRIRASSLDEMLHSVDELLIESLRQNHLAAAIEQMRQTIEQFSGDWGILRQFAALRLRETKVSPATSHMAQALDNIDRHSRELRRRQREVRLLQKRGAWSLHSLGQGLRRSVREARMTTAASVFDGFRKMVRDLARGEGKEAELRIVGFESQVDRVILQSLKDPLMHMLRNSVHHGIESPAQRETLNKPRCGDVLVELRVVGNHFEVLVEDDGRGIDTRRIVEQAIKLGLLSAAEAAERSPSALMQVVFEPGFSTAERVGEIAGRGMGLSVVHEAMVRLQGKAEMRVGKRGGACISLSMPTAVSMHRLLIVRCGGQTLALPVRCVERLIRVKKQALATVEGRSIVEVDHESVLFATLATLLKLASPEPEAKEQYIPTVVIRLAGQKLAIGVDALLDERDALIQDLKGPAARSEQFIGGVLLEDGTVALVLNPSSLRMTSKAEPAKEPPAINVVTPVAPSQPRVLVVDDSFTTRTLERSILETHGFHVTLATDGIEALNILRNEKIDLVISDVEMPRLDGFSLLEQMKKDPRWSRLPVILVTSLDKREQKERGMALGADAYIVKRKFDHQDLLETIKQVL